MNILISSAGRRVSLVKAFQKELKRVYPEAKVVACDSNPELSAACQIADISFKVPRLDDPDYITSLLAHCVAHSVRMIVPTIDTELPILALNKALFLEKGIHVIVSSIELVDICANKRRTANFFADHQVDPIRELDKQNPEFPLFVKPVNGSAGKGLQVIKNKSMLSNFLINSSEYMFQEYINEDAVEYTLDMYYDHNSRLQCVVPRERLEVRGGEVSKGITRKNFLVDFVKDRLLYILGAIGCVTFQVFALPKQDFVIGIEVNLRFGGGYPLSYLAGANFPKMLIDEYFLSKSLSFDNKWQENILMLRYDDEVISS